MSEYTTNPSNSTGYEYSGDGLEAAVSCPALGWAAPKHVSTCGLNAVSCPSASFCVAVDNMGYVMTYNGTSWSAPADIDGTRPMRALSCVSSSFCVTGDSMGDVLTYNGSGPADAGGDPVNGTDPSGLFAVPGSSGGCVSEGGPSDWQPGNP